MQAIIMAAGKGSRLGELTNGLPKSFLEINNKTLIDYNIDALHDLGINNIVIVTGYRCDMFEEKFKSDESITLVHNPFYELANVLSSFWVGNHLLNEDFVYLHADTICDRTILLETISDISDIVLPVDFKPCDEEAMKVRIDNGKVVEINKTMSCSDASGEFIGIAKFNKCTIHSLRKHADQALKCGLLNAYFEEALQRLIDEHKYSVNCINTQDRFWAEIDFEEDYIRAKNLFS